MGTFKVRQGSSWTTISNGTAFKVRSGGSWVNPSKVKIRKAGAWVDVWAKSNSVQLVFQAVDSN